MKLTTGWQRWLAAVKKIEKKERKGVTLCKLAPT